MARDVTVGFSGDASSIIREYEKTIQKQGDIIAAMKATKATSKEAGQEIDKAFGRRAQKVLKDLQTPLDAYIAKRKDIKKMVAEGLIDPTKARQATDAAKALYRSTTEGARLTAEESRRANEEIKRLTDRSRSIFESVKTSHDKHKDKIRDLRESYKRNVITLDQYKTGLRGLRDQYRTVEQGGVNAFGPNMVSHLKGVAAALGLGGGIAGALKLVVDQYKNVQKVQLEAFQMRKEHATHEELTAMNLGAISPSEREAFNKGIDSISNDLDVSPLSIQRRFRSAISRRSGDTSLDDVLAAVRSSYKYSRYEDEAGSSAAGFAVSMRPHGYTPGAAIGLFDAGLTKANIDNPVQFGKNFPKTITASRQAGFSDRQATGLFGAVSTALNDDSGDITKTAMNSLYMAIDKYKLKGGKFIPGDSTNDKINWLLNHREEGIKFAETAPLGQAAPTFKEFFGGGEPLTNYRQYTKSLPAKDKLDEYLNTVANARKNTKNMQAARTGDFLDERNRRMLEAIPGDMANLAKYKEEFTQIAEKAGVWAPARGYYRMRAWAGGDDAGEWGDNYRSLQSLLSERAYGAGSHLKKDGTWHKTGDYMPGTAQTRQQAVGQLGEVTQIVAALDKLDARMEQTNKLLEQQEAVQQQTADNTTKSPALDNNDRD